MISRMAVFGGGIAVAMLINGCSSSSSPAAGTRSAATTSSSAVSGQQSARVTPATKLRDKQTVTVSAKGFTPGKSLQVVECFDHGQATGPADCNLTGMKPVTAGADGTVTVKLRVLRTGFGDTHETCSAKQRCLISVTEAALTPTEEADAAISFAN